MSLPPILSNLSIFKIFSRHETTKSGKAIEQSTAPRPAMRDVVDISPEGLKKLSDIESRPVKASEAKTLAVVSGKILADNGLTLGLDPRFQE